MKCKTNLGIFLLKNYLNMVITYDAIVRSMGKMSRLYNAVHYNAVVQINKKHKRYSFHICKQISRPLPFAMEL